MTHARSHIRVCDAYGNRRGVVALDRTFYEIGSDRTRRGEPGYIHLEGSGVELRHARLVRSHADKSWTVTVLGANGSKLGRRTLERDATADLAHGDELWLGSNLLQLMDVNKSITQVAVMPELADLEMMMNEALLDFEDRRRDLFDGDPQQREQLLSDELNRILSVELDLAGRPEMNATVNRYCMEALRRPLISACLMTGTRGDIELAFSELNPEQRAKSIELREELASELGLEMTPESTARDLARLHEGFGAAFKAVSGMIGGNLKLALIRDAVREKVLGLFFRLGPIQFLIDVPAISEIMVCGHDRVFVEKGNAMFETGLRFASERELFTVAARIAGRDGKQLTEGAPMADARLPDGSRVNAVIPPLALDGSYLTIRKFAVDPYTADDLIGFGTMTRTVTDFLAQCVKGDLNILVSGGTGAGKTTTLNVLSSFIPPGERIVTIEDAAELQLHQEHVLRMESRPPNIEGRGEVTIRDLVRNSLRMRPDRIVVGEIRDAAALDMLQAMNTGHDGSICTVHANSPRDTLSRVETMVLMAGVDLPVRAIREQVSSAIDLIVHQSRFKDGSRHITQVTEVVGMEGDTITLQDIFRFDYEAGYDDQGHPLGRLKTTGLRPKFLDKLAAAGVKVDPTIFAFERVGA